MTTRDPEIWLAGCRSTILPRSILNPRSAAFHLLRRLIGLEKLDDLFIRNCKYIFGLNIDFSNDSAVLKGFVNWNDHVIKTVLPEKLLRFDLAEGWSPLCKFLQKPIPTCPFPHLNEYKEVKRLLLLEKYILNLIQFGLPILFMIGLTYFVKQIWF